MTNPKGEEIDPEPKNCRHCGTKTLFKVIVIEETKEYYSIIINRRVDNPVDADASVTHIIKLLRCLACSKVTLEEIIDSSEEWYPGYEPPVDILYPAAPNPTPPPVKDMPEDITTIYNEAREVLSRSPKASAALLRLAIQYLCIHLGKPGKDINKDIGALVKEGLTSSVQQALDSVRVIGNSAVHPGSISFDDNPQLAETLFKLVNFIVEEMITKPREIKEIYESLPQEKLDGIKQRDRGNAVLSGDFEG